MIDFTKLTGIEHGGKVVTQIEDSDGRVMWAVSGGKIVLEVEKITSDTYAGETLYENEKFILLNIYPKTNGTVKVTYGGLTKTITDTSGAEEPNSQEVYFGTFEGESDSLETPDAGALTIDGALRYVCVGAFAPDSRKGSVKYCNCVTAARDWGNVTEIRALAFRDCPMEIERLPEGIVSIGAQAFYSNSKMNNRAVTLPSTLENIYLSAFIEAGSLTDSEGVFYPSKIIVLATTPPIVGDADYFYDYLDGFSIIVPKGCSSAYKEADGWVRYKSKIGEAS